MILLSCGYLPQYKIPEVEKHKIITRNCVVILKIKKMKENNQSNIYFQTSHCFSSLCTLKLWISVYFSTENVTFK